MEGGADSQKRTCMAMVARVMKPGAFLKACTKAAPTTRLQQQKDKIHSIHRSHERTR